MHAVSRGGRCGRFESFGACGLRVVCALCASAINALPRKTFSSNFPIEHVQLSPITFAVYVVVAVLFVVLAVVVAAV